MSETSTTYRYLAPRPKSGYRQLFIKGTRIRAEIVYGYTVPSAEDGFCQAPEEVAADFGLPVEAVLEAIAYCKSNPPEIEMDHRREDLIAELSGMNHPEYKWNPKKYRRQVDPAELARRMRDEGLS